jgi:hypothetical protein
MCGTPRIASSARMVSGVADWNSYFSQSVLDSDTRVRVRPDDWSPLEGVQAAGRSGDHTHIINDESGRNPKPITDRTVPSSEYEILEKCCGPGRVDRRRLYPIVGNARRASILLGAQDLDPTPGLGGEVAVPVQLLEYLGVRFGRAEDSDVEAVVRAQKGERELEQGDDVAPVPVSMPNQPCLWSLRQLHDYICLGSPSRRGERDDVHWLGHCSCNHFNDAGMRKLEEQGMSLG